jgi:outer membrane protein assembly factor BamB
LLLIAVGSVALMGSPMAGSRLAFGQSNGETEWPLPRGDAQSTGRSANTLPEKLTILWEAKADEAIEATPVVGGGRVICADVTGKVYAFDQRSGELLWKQDFGTGFIASPAISGQTVVLGDFDGNIFALDAKTGEQRWKQTTEGEVSGSVGFYQQNVLATSSDGKLYCFALQDGAVQWTYQTDDQVKCSPTVAGDRTFLGGCDGQLHVVDLKTGKSVDKPLPLGGPTGSTPAVLGSKAFVPIMDGAVLAFDYQTGELLWRYEDEERPQEYRNSAAVSEDVVIVSSQFKQVDAISIETGKRKWRSTLRRRADASPVIAGPDVWIAATDGRLVRLDLQTGAEKWTFEIRGSFLAAPAIAGKRLYIADDNGFVRCFGESDTTKAEVK